MYRAVVFDLDGTLVHSPLCFNSIREQLGIPKGEFILEYLENFAPTEKAKKLVQLELIEILAAKEALPFPGVLNLLGEMKNLNIGTGIFTRNCRGATSSIIEKFEMKIDLVVTREDALPKPDPEGLRIFLKRWSLKPHELLFVGDFRSDIECGKKAGVRTALFSNEKEYAQEWNPDYVIPHFSKFWSSIE